MKPIVIKEDDGFIKTIDILKEKDIKSVFISASYKTLEQGYVASLLDQLDELRIEYAIYTDFKNEQNDEDIEYGLDFYQDNNCEGIIVIGDDLLIDYTNSFAMKVALMPNKRLLTFIAIYTTNQ